MLSVSEAYSRAVNADTRSTFHRVTIAGIELDQTSAPKMIFNESVSGNNGVSLGTSNSASLQLTLKNPPVVDYTEMLVEPESGIELPDGTIVWLPLGKFWVTDSSTSNDYKTVNLTCADGMYLMSGEYVSSLTYPALVEDVAREIAEQAGVELAEPDEWPEIYIRKKPEGITLRNAIGYVAGCCGKNAKFNRYGKLELVWYKDTGITIELEQQYLDGFTRLNEQPLNVDFEIKGEDEKYKVTIVSDDNGSVVATPGTNVLEGDTVSLSVMPLYGYKLASISANISTGESVALFQNADGDEYTFVQPDSDVTVTVTFKDEGDDGEVIVNPAVGGEYSFLQHPSFASPPTNKPYWAIFYKHDTDVGPNAKYYLVWFDSWSLGDKIYLSGERRGYYLNIDGYYYCRGANNGRAQHYWDNDVWQGNGASGSPLSWRTGVGRWCDDYGLLASNISLYDGDTLFFENNESEVGTIQTSFVVNGVDVREKGVFNLYSCPDTYSTPLPAKYWMLTNKARVYKTGTDGRYDELFGGSSYDPYILFFDGCVIQDIGKYYDFHEGNYLKITFSKLVVASYLNYKTFYYSNERTFNEECYIIISDPDYSSAYESGGGLEYPNGLYATNLSSSYFNNNSCMICDCVSVASEPMKFAMRRNVGATVTMEYTNPLITSKMVDSITAVVQGVSYTPSKVKHRGNPAFEAGDIVTVPDKNDNYHKVLIMQQTLTFGGGMNSVITCPGQTEKKASFSANGALTTQIKQAVQGEISNQKKETDAYNSLVLSTMSRSMSSISRKVTEDSAELKLLNEWRDDVSLSLTELSTQVTENEASIRSFAKWQSETSESIASIEQTATENGASIKLLTEWQSGADKKFSSIEQTLDGIDLSVYAKTSDLNGYATTEQLSKISEELGKIDLSVYARVSDLNEFVSIEEVESKISMELGKIDLTVSEIIEDSIKNCILIGTGEPITLTAGTDNYKYQELLFSDDLIGEYTFSAVVENLAGSPSNIYVVFGNLNYQYVTSATFPIVNGRISGSVNFSDAFDRLMIYAGEFGKTAGNTIRFSKMKLAKEKYATLEKLSSEISLTKNSINASVSKTLKDYTTKAEFELGVDNINLSLENYATKAELALTIENGVSKLSAHADKILFEAGEIEINSDNLCLLPDGTLYCKAVQGNNYMVNEVVINANGIDFDSTVTVTANGQTKKTYASSTMNWWKLAEIVEWYKKASINGEIIPYSFTWS